MATLVYRWLEAIGLAHAVPKFHAMHISTPLALMEISPEDHALLGVTDKFEVRLLTELVKRLRAEVDGAQLRLGPDSAAAQRPLLLTDGTGDRRRGGASTALVPAAAAAAAAAATASELVAWDSFDPDAEGVRRRAAAAAVLAAAEAARLEAERLAREAVEAEIARILRERLFGAHGSRARLSDDHVCVTGRTNDGGNWAVVHGAVVWGPCSALLVIDACGDAAGRASAGAAPAIWVGAAVEPEATCVNPFTSRGFTLVEMASGETLVDAEFRGRLVPQSMSPSHQGRRQLERWVPVGVGVPIEVEVDLSGIAESHDGCAVHVTVHEQRFALPQLAAPRGAALALHFCVVVGRGATMRLVNVDYTNNTPPGDGGDERPTRVLFIEEEDL